MGQPSQPMNRSMKRMAKKMGQADDEGQQGFTPREPRPQVARGARVGPVQFIRDVSGELKKVIWPSKRDVWNYTLVTLFTLILIGAIIYVLDSFFVRGAGFLFK